MAVVHVLTENPRFWRITPINILGPKKVPKMPPESVDRSKKKVIFLAKTQNNMKENVFLAKIPPSPLG